MGKSSLLKPEKLPQTPFGIMPKMGPQVPKHNHLAQGICEAGRLREREKEKKNKFLNTSKRKKKEKKKERERERARVGRERESAMERDDRL